MFANCGNLHCEGLVRSWLRRRIPGLPHYAVAQHPRPLRIYAMVRHMRRASVAACVVVGLGLAAAPGALALEGIHKIQHIVVIMQENRSFDNYFGTYPGANGIPAGVCVPDPLPGGCVAPFYDANDKNNGGPHGTEAAVADIDGGKMDGFVGQVGKAEGCTGTNPSCNQCPEGNSTSSECEDAMAITTPARSPTTGRTPGTSCCRMTCSSPTLRGVCLSTCSWSGVVRCLPRR